MTPSNSSNRLSLQPIELSTAVFMGMGEPRLNL